VSEWISVYERLPDRDGHYPVIVEEYPKAVVDTCEWLEGGWVAAHGRQPTHWHELPTLLEDDTAYDGPIAKPIAEYRFQFVSAEKADRLRALLRRWTEQARIHPCSGTAYLVPCEDATLLGDTLKELGE